MSALPNLLPSQRKAPARASRPSKLNQYGRDPQSPGERLRASSDFDKERGYAPFFHSLMADLPRISSGKSCTDFILLCFSRSLGRGTPKGGGRYEWTQAMDMEEVAQICCCDVRTIQRESKYLQGHGIAEVKRAGDLLDGNKRLEKGQLAVRLLFREWEAVPNYKSAVIEMPASDDADVPDPETVDETKPGNQRVTGRKPVRLAAGAVSKAFPVTAGVRSFRHKAEGDVDLEFSCVVQAGELLVVSRFPDDWREKVQKSQGPSNRINGVEGLPRHGCRGESEGAPVNGGGAIPPKATVNHPRSGELSALFDPILARSAARLLSGDAKALQAACIAVGDCDHNFLVKFAVERAERPVKSPLYVEAICKEALASWRASKVLDGAGLKTKSPTREEIEVMVRRDKEALAKAQAEVNRRYKR